MRRNAMRISLTAAAALLFFAYLPATAAKLQCTTIQSGLLLRSDNVVIETGYDEWGYNYQGRMFRGGYCDAYRDASWCQPYKDTQLIMKWNGPWLDNKDCTDDGLLDRHRDTPTYIGSGAWLTNHMRGTCMVERNGRKRKGTWTYFVKIVAAPADANKVAAVWYAAGGAEIGPAIWGDFAIVEDVTNDRCCDDSGICNDQHGNQYVSPYSPGFGAYKPKSP
jgi:hypothetical protein